MVVLRKLTFGRRTDVGATGMAQLMTVAETSRRHGKGVRDIYYGLYVCPPDKVLRSLDAVR
jgi:transposase